MAALLLPTSNPTALWYEIIHEAEHSCALNLKEEVEAYLVFLMMRYIKQPGIAQEIVANNLLKSLNLKHNERSIALKDVADQCLFFSGLFPKIASKRLVKLSYFIKIGRSSYAMISNTENDIFC